MKPIFYLGFLVMLALDTFCQVAFKFAGERTLPVTLDAAWVDRVLNEPWTYAIFIGYGLAFFVYMSLMKHAAIGPVFAASHLEIVTISLISFYAFGERLTALQWVGCAAILSGVMVLALTESGAPPEAETLSKPDGARG
jgi:multidrug transporter EmrE-like cation transporter